MARKLYWSNRSRPDKIDAGFPSWDRYSQQVCERSLHARQIADRFADRALNGELYHPPEWVKKRLMEVSTFWMGFITREMGVQCIPFSGRGEPYHTEEEMSRDCFDNHRHLMRIRSAGPVSGHCTMWFRAVHDVLGHCRQHAPFTFSGEVLAYTDYCNRFPPECWPFGWNNIVAENTYRLVHGQFLCISAQCSSPFVFDEDHFGCSQVEWERRHPINRNWLPGEVK